MSVSCHISLVRNKVVVELSNISFIFMIISDYKVTAQSINSQKNFHFSVNYQEHGVCSNWIHYISYLKTGTTRWGRKSYVQYKWNKTPGLSILISSIYSSIQCNIIIEHWSFQLSIQCSSICDCVTYDVSMIIYFGVEKI